MKASKLGFIFCLGLLAAPPSTMKAVCKDGDVIFGELDIPGLETSSDEIPECDPVPRLGGDAGNTDVSSSASTY